MVTVGAHPELEAVVEALLPCLPVLLLPLSGRALRRGPWSLKAWPWASPPQEMAAMTASMTCAAKLVVQGSVAVK